MAFPYHLPNFITPKFGNPSLCILVYIPQDPGLEYHIPNLRCRKGFRLGQTRIIKTFFVLASDSQFLAVSWGSHELGITLRCSAEGRVLASLYEALESIASVQKAGVAITARSIIPAHRPDYILRGEQRMRGWRHGAIQRPSASHGVVG